MNEFDKIQYRGHEISIFYDEGHESPDDWGNDDTFLIYDHRELFVERKGFDPDEIFENAYSKGKKLYDGYWLFPCYALIHSGIWLSLRRANCTAYDPGGWDTSFKGFIMVKRMKGWSWTEDQAFKAAHYTLDTWNDYLSGNVFGYETDTNDSCHGYYGNPEKSGLIDDAKANIDSWIKDKAQEHARQLKAQIKNKVAIQYRKPLTI